VKAKQAKDMRKEEIARDLRRELGWDQAAEANVDSEIGLVLDMGMVQKAVEVGTVGSWGDILPLVVQNFKHDVLASDRHGYSDRENPTYLEQWCNSYSKDTDLGSVLIYVTTVPWVSRDSAGGEWDIDRRCSNGVPPVRGCPQSGIVVEQHHVQ